MPLTDEIWKREELLAKRRPIIYMGKAQLELEAAPVDPPLTPESVTEKIFESVNTIDLTTTMGEVIVAIAKGASDARAFAYSMIATWADASIIDASIEKMMEKGWENVYHRFESACGVVPEKTEANEKINASISEEEGSRTAKWVQTARMIAFDCGFGPDSMAHLFSDEKSRKESARAVEHFRSTTLTTSPDMTKMTLQKGRDWVSSKPYRGLDMVGQMQVRTCFFDDAVVRFAELYPDSPSNFIVLGAGYDTRGYRLDLPKSMLCWEIDALGTQKVKLKKLAELGEQNPSIGRNVHFVDCDFGEQDWVGRGIEAGLDTSLPTFVLWEGVTYYLQESVVRNTFAMIENRFSGVCVCGFDYMTNRAVEASNSIMGSIREPLLFGVENADEIEKMVHEVGLRVEDHISPAEGGERYMPRLGDHNNRPSGFLTTLKYFVVAGNSRFKC